MKPDVKPDVKPSVSGTPRTLLSPDHEPIASGIRSVSLEADDEHPFDYADEWAERNLPDEVDHRNMTDAERDEFYRKAIINLDFETSVTVAEAKKILNIPEGADAVMPGLSVPLYP